MNLKVTSFLALIFGCAGVNAQTSLSQINLAHQYETNKSFDLKTYGHKGEKVVVFAAYKLPDTVSTLTVSFWGAEDYQKPVVRIDSLLEDEFYLGARDGYHYYEYHFKTEFPLLALELVTGENTSQVYDVFFDDQKYNLVLYSAQDKIPVVDRWLKKNVSYNATDLDEQNIELYISYYPFNFNAATPPMSGREIKEKELKKDSSYISFDNGNLQFNEDGYYLFQKDTNSFMGYGWIVKEEPFPGLNKLEQLIPPLRYITTSDEYASLIENNDKASFDKFWLKLGKNQEAARSMINKFYGRVEAANRFFTSYKEGWKTDMGMIYTIYGPPHKVVRNSQEEVWVYLYDGGQEVFRFLRFTHIFYPYNYVLMRDSKYKSSWFTAVDLVRNNRF